MSQTKRDPMLLLELEAELFQLEHREPELELLFQLPPNREACFLNQPLCLTLEIQKPSNFPTVPIKIIVVFCCFKVI